MGRRRGSWEVDLASMSDRFHGSESRVQAGDNLTGNSFRAWFHLGGRSSSREAARCPGRISDHRKSRAIFQSEKSHMFSLDP